VPYGCLTTLPIIRIVARFGNHDYNLYDNPEG